MKPFVSLMAVALFAFAGVASAPPAAADTKACPPGLAKKSPPCVPPGQAKKGVTTDEWQNRDRVGEIVDHDDLTYLDDFLRYEMRPLPEGQRYAVIDDRIVVIDSESFRILQLIRIFTALD
jgi:hypothetical protein